MKLAETEALIEGYPLREAVWAALKRLLGLAVGGDIDALKLLLSSPLVEQADAAPLVSIDARQLSAGPEPPEGDALRDYFRELREVSEELDAVAQRREAAVAERALLAVEPAAGGSSSD